MGQFGTETRKWLESAIKQRKLLLKLNKSHKSQLEVEMAIQVLDGLLSAYTYENDVYMARFIRQNIGWIENILPGSGATGHQKRMEQLTEINKRAILIIDQNPPYNPPRGGIKSTAHMENKSKTTQYEMVF
jgi:hypothetical protein